jgi:GAF domain-containing protein
MESPIKRAISGDVNGSPEGIGRRYEAILRLSELLSQCQEPEGLTEILSEELHEFLTFLRFYIIVYKENSTEVEWSVLGREKEQIASYADVPVQQRPSWQAYITQEPFHIHDWKTDKSIPARLKEGVASLGRDVGPLVFVPLTTPHRRLGALGMSGSPGTVCTDDDIAFLRLIGRVVAFAIHDNFNLRQAAAARAELQRQNDRLQRSERELREVVERIPGMTWTAAPRLQAQTAIALMFFAGLRPVRLAVLGGKTTAAKHSTRNRACRASTPLIPKQREPQNPFS